jgi:hypothetical protein
LLADFQVSFNNVLTSWLPKMIVSARRR